ncbi:MAG: hypothetical protein ACI4XG_27200, partial [Bradyrhizobium sp.]
MLLLPLLLRRMTRGRTVRRRLNMRRGRMWRRRRLNVRLRRPCRRLRMHLGWLRMRGRRLRSVRLGVRQRLGALTDLAPLHQPKSLAALDAVQAALPDVPAVACFDTAFHATIPDP